MTSYSGHNYAIMFDVKKFQLSKKLYIFFNFWGNAMSSSCIKHLTAMFCNEFYEIASFILFSAESKIYFVVFGESNWCLLLFYFIFTFSFCRVINNNKMSPKEKQNLYTFLAEQQQLLEHFYNDLGDETFLDCDFGGKGENKRNISSSS